MEYATLELNASEHGWNCSECGQKFDSIGRPLSGKEMWIFYSKGTAWLENKPKIKFCPGCGKPIKEV